VGVFSLLNHDHDQLGSASFLALPLPSPSFLGVDHIGKQLIRNIRPCAPSQAGDRL
jgi:hypothetical protein